MPYIYKKKIRKENWDLNTVRHKNQINPGQAPNFCYSVSDCKRTHMTEKKANQML